MTFLQRVLVLALVPLTVWGGSPHLACRCSSGDIRLFCPQLTLQANQRNSTACCTSGDSGHKSCCGAAICCGSESSEENTECWASGCRCTPILLQTDTGPTLKKVDLPELIQLDLAAIAVMEIRLPRITRVDLRTVHVNDRVPDDLIVLCERWLI